MTFTNQFIKVSGLAMMCLLSYVLKIDAFSSSPVVSALRFSASALYQQVLDVDDNENNNGEQEAPRPFFFTGEAKSESENRELRRVFLGAESLRSSADGTIEQEAAAFIEDTDGAFLNGATEEEGTGGHAVNFDQERENLERLFRM
mmetsp:Transcript_3657/g.8414  ORF Transcript_3657/g.8414 Transcript_3657/m.8414 type:complete len:146 (+) Transcript_3657:65-502(+)|eukprot:CAMPEP_0113637894 /NCGR_PEP_ID=MMETSP0017_2-20120614/19846_1 /TAXON_ID=2856 /ORGANISM="Cylindrotheca closterium" /LENGTH=145 /DNA_ID=CAMNT_0000548965 /DNA_START=22 /DNA_END=459 /DNA_ORIENTATION=- /assembly_acc=CAM_ASM_000147